MVEKCKYEQKYFSGELTEVFKCNEDAVEDGYCVFHHPNYWEKHKKEVREKFMKKVEDAIKNKEPLFCIGYNLPEVDLSKKKFEAPVCFYEAVFHEDVNFN
ncbi:MAG: hypothetical protein ACP5IZ_01785, partial [Thermoprotei archaeon]